MITWRYLLAFGADWLIRALIGVPKCPWSSWCRKSISGTCNVCGRGYVADTGSTICQLCLGDVRECLHERPRADPNKGEFLFGTTLVRTRRGTSAEWDRFDPILKLGELGFDKDTGGFKMGDEKTPWRDLPWWREPTEGIT